ncbi:hypothetical protein GCM10008961_30860 [Deinococcus knuensis]|uniref:Transposase IS204/IS1001/IS1096/IS1165 DDE domain-containing protein n=1 Tax=Deinococcus knuensis TaxID=1837380 RepID=A0ABQ2SQI8_9DEIO|nr:hypothetical protein GCM10008961_30860 [Deinococcus knuensis]
MQRIPPYSLQEGFRPVSYTTPGAPHEPYLVTIAHEPEQPCGHCEAAHPVRSRPSIRIHDVPYDGHPVILLVTEGWWACPVTRQRSELSYAAGRLRCTDALQRYVARQQGHLTLRALATETGLSTTKVSRLQQQAADRLIRPAALARVRHLGLDDIYIRNHQHLVAVNLGTQRVLALTPVGNVTQGRAGQIDVDAFLKGLPDADVVALDMHPVQYAAARKRWPKATLVIDKRHLLAVIDRELLAQAAEVILAAHDDEHDDDSRRRFVSRFGAAAYPYLALRTLVLRRRSALTAADHVMWSLLRSEGTDRTRLLWEMYQWREALYGVYDREQRDPAALKQWLEGVKAWQRQQPQKRNQAPLGRICWALNTYPEACAAYLTTGVTNGATERANARIRRVLRQGHRYNLQTLMDLVNQVPYRTPALRAATYDFPPSSRPSSGRRSRPPAPVAVTPPAAPLPAQRPTQAPTQKPAPEPAQPPAQRPPEQRPPEPARPAPPALKPTPRVPARHLPKQHPDMAVPLPVWHWLHSRTCPERRGSPRWTAHIAQLAPADSAAEWHLLNAGQVLTSADDRVSTASLLAWRTAVLYQYARDQSREFIPRLQERFRAEVDILNLYATRPDLAQRFHDALLRLSAERFLSPTDEEQVTLRAVLGVPPLTGQNAGTPIPTRP